LNKEELISIGQVLKPHGLHGELRVLSFSSFPERFKALKDVFILFKDKIELFSVENTRFHKKFILIKLKGIDKLEEAEKLRGAEIMIKEEEIWRKDENFYYYYELIGLECFLPKGEYLGVVSGIEELKEGVNLLVKDKSGFEYSIPFVKKFIKVERGKKIIVKPVPGLISKNED